MYQFFVEDEQIANDLVIIEGSDVNHIRNVLRMKCGEKVRISSTSGRNFFGTIDRIAENVVEVCITEETALDTELPCRICLFQGLPKSDKMELIVQKAVELGAAEVIPVAMKNCVVKLDAKIKIIKLPSMIPIIPIYIIKRLLISALARIPSIDTRMAIK